MKATVIGREGLEVTVESHEDGVVYVLKAPQETTESDLEKYFPLGEVVEFEKQERYLQ